MIPKKVSDRIAKTLGGFQKILASAKDRDVNEADTVTIVADIVATVFGFDKYPRSRVNFVFAEPTAIWP
ncbi:MAG TPA: hypothetical protein DEQ20_06120 [Desulfobulbaceae bacterium]|nr:MAG: hypothetical protein A2520_09635 [Deltaproteobacteria bacterium RIFOXYD12_FULL_53_23]HCC54485.1 hypothetical protein [Desulfobulbaceae bacterium]